MLVEAYTTYISFSMFDVDVRTCIVLAEMFKIPGKFSASDRNEGTEELYGTFS